MMDDLPNDEWGDRWDEYGTHVGSTDPVTIRVGIYQPNGDPDAGSIALCTSGGRPILLDDRAARSLSELFIWSADAHRLELRFQREWRQAAARDLVDAAVLSREQWHQVLAAVKDGDHADALTDLLTACAPERWHPDKHVSEQE